MGAARHARRRRPGRRGRTPGAAPADEVVGVGQVGVAEGRAHGRDLAPGQEEPPGGPEGREALDVVLGLVGEGLVDLEAGAGQPGGRPQRAAQRHAAPPLEGPLPGGEGAGRADRDAAGHQVGGERVGLTGPGVEEGVARDRQRGGLAPVDGGHLPGAPVEVHEVAPAADAGAVGLGHAQRRRRGDGGVDGVAAALEHGHADAGGVGVDRGDGAPGADRGGLLGRHPGAGGGRVGRSDHADGADGADGADVRAGVGGVGRGEGRRGHQGAGERRDRGGQAGGTGRAGASHHGAPRGGVVGGGPGAACGCRPSCTRSPTDGRPHRPAVATPRRGLSRAGPPRRRSRRAGRRCGPGRPA